MWISSRTTSAGSSVPDPIRIGIVAGETSGDILAAEFVNQGAIYRAVLNTDGNYYTPDGKAMRKSFLRAPVNFKYIS